MEFKRGMLVKVIRIKDDTDAMKNFVGRMGIIISIDMFDNDYGVDEFHPNILIDFGDNDYNNTFFRSEVKMICDKDNRGNFLRNKCRWCSNIETKEFIVNEKITISYCPKCLR